LTDRRAAALLPGPLFQALTPQKEAPHPIHFICHHERKLFLSREKALFIVSANLFSRDKKGSDCVPAALLPVSCTHIPCLFSTLIPKLKSEKAEAYSLMQRYASIGGAKKPHCP
jgi:hypothetical protein